MNFSRKAISDLFVIEGSFKRLLKYCVLILFGLSVIDLIVKFIIYYNDTTTGFAILLIYGMFVFIPKIFITLILLIYVISEYYTYFKILSKTQKYFILFVMIFSLSSFDVGIGFSYFIHNSPFRKNILPANFANLEIEKTGYFKDKKTLIILSPNKEYKLVKYLKDPVMSFGSGATIISVYNKNDKHMGELTFGESDFNLKMAWLNDKEIQLDFGNSNTASRKIKVTHLKGTRKFKIIEINLDK